MRLFVAIELDRTLRCTIARFMRENLPADRDVRWCGEDQLHITLKFLGDVHEDRLSSVCDVISETAAMMAPFELRIGELGHFPPRGGPRVMWMGVQDADANCAKWLALADGPFADLGFEPQRRALTPHITLGRTKNRAGGELVASLVKQLDGPAPMSMRMRVGSLTLFESRLTPSGAQYKSVLNAALAAR